MRIICRSIFAGFLQLFILLGVDAWLMRAVHAEDGWINSTDELPSAPIFQDITLSWVLITIDEHSRLYVGFSGIESVPSVIVWQFGERNVQGQSVEICLQGRDTIGSSNDLCEKIWAKLGISRILMWSAIVREKLGSRLVGGIESVGKSVASGRSSGVKMLIRKDPGAFDFGFVAFAPHDAVHPVAFASSVYANVPAVVEANATESIVEIPFPTQPQGKVLLSLGKRGAVFHDSLGKFDLSFGSESLSLSSFDPSVLPGIVLKVELDTTMKKRDMICLCACSRDFWQGWNRIAPAGSRFSSDPNEPIAIDPLLLCTKMN